MAVKKPALGRGLSSLIREAIAPSKDEAAGDRLLTLPAFLDAGTPASHTDIAAAFKLTGHFLDMHIWHPRQLEPPATREALIAILTR